ncbi:MAG: hypothetical protein VSS75_019380 [Candidatus Parabeggiatoa sp.]|nr:hypothetical protein [Candidatus Parabeggiatoa sp.]
MLRVSNKQVLLPQRATKRDCPLFWLLLLKYLKIYGSVLTNNSPPL